MKVLWCWRCKMDIPMLNEEEYVIASELYGAGIRDTKITGSMALRFKPLLDYYKNITGFEATELL